jgi:hypothetical protein
MAEQNDQAVIATKFINSTNRNIFLTGRAGTGKTTFLQYIVENTHKNALVAAPTGIAAINAGGVTLHSLFHLPFGCFVPSDFSVNVEDINTQVNTPQSIRKSLRMNSRKRKLIREMELLIIDEVSMMRADLLDAIDVVLRTIKKRKSLPFGGTQILFIGDLYQLPPVVRSEEWDFLKRHYSTPYFFDARVLHQFQPVYIELEKIYRQTDQRFISILNHFRDNAITREDIQTLNQRYFPDFKPKSNEGYVFLTTHNKTADDINRRTLAKLPGQVYSFNAEVEGDFGEHLYPIDYQLQLKEGAQVMFIKNDYSGEQRYFNGKIGTVSEISEEGIEVSFTDGSEPTLVEEYTWENKKFSLNKETGEIEETIKGTFKHLPIKLAWAITIHKSQGLTFQKAIIDVSKAFAPGQIYVALSRLVSLDGLVLNRPLPENIMEPDEALKLFSQNKKDPKALEKEYKQELPRYITDVILRSFDFSSMLNEIQAHIETYQKDEKRSIKQKHKSWAIELKKDVAELKEIGDRFQKQIHSITQQSDDDWLYNLQGRVQSAKSYFKTQLESLSEKVLQHIDDLQGQAGVKKYIEELKELENLFFRQNKHIHKANALIDAAIKNKEISKETLDDKTLLKERQKQLNSKAASTKKKKPKKKTKEITLELYKKGNTIEEIAQERSLAESTIEGHLAHFVGKGELHLTEFLDETKAGQIQQVADTLKTTKLNEIKSRLGDEFTYTDLKFAMAGYEVKGD